MCYKWVESLFRHMYSTVSQKKEGFSHSNGLEWCFVQSTGCCATERPKKLWSATLKNNHGFSVFLCGS